MPSITEDFVNSLAPNQSAISNGWGLVKKNSFVKLQKDADETILMGECKGSGASNYKCSADFIKPENPVFRCTCPSRQFPCKHSLGLLYAYINNKEFEVADIPEDIIEKRGKIDKRDEKKKETAEKGPKKVNKQALVKKFKAQVEGLSLLEKIITGIVQSGLGTVNEKTVKLLEQQVKELGNFYVPGVQTALREFAGLFSGNENHDEVYSQAIEKILMMSALIRKGREYLNEKIEGKKDTAEDSILEELIGNAWQLSQLSELGLTATDTELVQLKISSYPDDARQEFVDAGAWISLSDGKIYETFNYRPYKALKYIREDDSFFMVAKPEVLYKYPGEMNSRVRWDSVSARELQKDDYKKIKDLSQKSLASVIKEVKNQIKNPLSNKNPLALVFFSKIGTVDGNLVLEDADGQRVVLSDSPTPYEPPTVGLIDYIEPYKLKGNAVLLRFHNNTDTGKLRAQPISIVTDDEIIRLSY
ncbi:MAG TPA: SWIM zinc finger family protein [Clostridia bacterium]